MSFLSETTDAGAQSPSETVQESAATCLARATVTALVRYGVRHVVVCPGSRSAPLVYALAAAEGAGWLRTHVCLDERSAGFYALGMALGQAEAEASPVAVVMTSGTAVANLHPAVLEATHAGVPLLVLSADRPHELRGTGANQTTEQVGIFGAAPRFAFDVPAGYAPQRMDALMRRAVQAALGAFSGDRGVAHLNLCFADPLVPTADWDLGQVPAPNLDPCRGLGPVQVFPRLAESMASGRVAAAQIDWSQTQTVIVAGANAGPEATTLAALTGWPCLAEPSSRARAAGSQGTQVRPDLPVVPLICDYQRALGLTEPSELANRVRQVIQLGRPTLSRPVSRLLASENARLVVLSEGANWPDQSASAVAVVAPVDAVAAAQQWHEGAPAQVWPKRTAWAAQWQEASSVPDLEASTSGKAEPTEVKTLAGQLCAKLWRSSAQQDVNLVIGASSIIRYFDRFAGSLPLSADTLPLRADATDTANAAEAGERADTGAAAVRVFANRGLAGIDGTLATARGIGRASGLPTRIVVGDLTFLHDAMSLLPSLGAEDEPWGAGLQVIVLNDGGGSIFAGLEHAVADPKLFARFFTTAQQCDLAAFAKSMGVSYRQMSLAEAGKAIDAKEADFEVRSGCELINIVL